MKIKPRQRGAKKFAYSRKKYIFVVITSKLPKDDTSDRKTKKLHGCQNEGAKNIIIDMSDARYCDSSGLSAILVGNRLCKNSGGMLVLTGLKESVKKLILISQLDSILNTALTLEEGISLIGAAKTSL